MIQSVGYFVAYQANHPANLGAASPRPEPLRGADSSNPLDGAVRSEREAGILSVK
jgi:hypothetical protein